MLKLSNIFESLNSILFNETTHLVKLIESEVGDLEKPFRVDHAVFRCQEAVLAEAGRVVQMGHTIDQIDKQAHLEEPVQLYLLVVDYVEQASSAALGRKRPK